VKGNRNAKRKDGKGIRRLERERLSSRNYEHV